MRFLQVTDHLNLVQGVSLRRVDNNNIHASFNQKASSLLIIRTSTNGSSTEQLFISRLLGGERILLLLLKIRSGNQGNKFILIIHHREFSFLRLLQHLVGLLQTDSFGRDRKLGTLRHKILNLDRWVLNEGSVTVRNNTHKTTSHFTSVCDGKGRESKSLFGLEDILKSIVGAQTDWVKDETVLVLLNLSNFGGLIFSLHVRVDNTNSSQKSHRGSHFMFGDSVHRRRNKGNLQLNVPCQLGRNIDISKSERDVTGHHDHIIVCIGHTGRVADENLGGSVPFGSRVEGLLVDISDLEALGGWFRHVDLFEVFK
mmetsp:Transcript_45053/g.130093  ORF Transcript_45053/g.130093 Transcript_45053/m.130093 type:complete len:313 (+) Transcript_45053:777-1715(+)